MTPFLKALRNVECMLAAHLAYELLAFFNYDFRGIDCGQNRRLSQTMSRSVRHLSNGAEVMAHQASGSFKPHLNPWILALGGLAALEGFQVKNMIR